MAAPRTQFYHPATQIDAALKSVERCIRRGEGVALVVGGPGTGKSLLLAMVAEHVRDDFDVALLSGASICTRRGLWQSILAAIGEPCRGADDGELRIAIVERIRSLAATGSGLVILVDEAATLPTRLTEELRLLTNIPTPLPAVHIVLAGGLRLEEMLAGPRMESLAQRIAVRGYLEPLDHAETMAYLRTQTRAASLDWDKLFAPGSDDAVFKATDGVPRLINQLCDQALVLVAECNRPVTPADIATAWREIQRLPPPSGLEPPAPPVAFVPTDHTAVDDSFGKIGDDAMEMIEFGAGDDTFGSDHASDAGSWDSGSAAAVLDAMADGHGDDPLAALFRDDHPGDTAWSGGGPDDFKERPQVASREGQAISRLLASLASAAPPAVSPPAPAAPAPAAAAVEADDDADMVVIIDDADDAEAVAGRVAPVRPDDYRSLFTRLRRGDRRA